MKKYLQLAIVLTICFFAHLSSIHANTRSLDDIYKIASAKLNETSGRSKARRSKSLNNQELKVFTSNETLTLVGYSDGGYVVVANDDRVVPILGYSDSKYDAANVSPEFQWWLTTTEQNIKKSINNGNKINYASSSIGDGAGPLLTTTWGQGYPYNKLCPSYTKDGQEYRCVTGCVATAMAQIINYHKYPDNGFGTKTYEVNINRAGIYQTLTFDYSNTIFDWNNMLDSYASYTTTQADAVATLMFACGVAMDMGYGTSASGASDFTLPTVLKTYFGYDCYLGTFSFSTIKAEIDNGNPVYYSGYGHAFVIDGYDENGLLHLNLGWDGLSDGYYLISDMNGFAGGGGQAFYIHNPNDGYEDYYGVVIDEIKYDLHGVDNSAIVVGLTSYPKNLVIPSTVSYEGRTYTVTKVSEIKGIGKELDSVVLPETIEEIGELAFWYSGIKSIKLPQGLKSIGGQAFQACEFSEIYIPSSVVSISNTAFDYCSNLVKIEVDKNNEYFASYDNALYDKSFTTLLTVSCGNTSSISVKEGVTIIGNAACRGAKLSSITLPSSLKSIQSEAFSGTYNLKEIYIPEGCTYVGKNAFAGGQTISMIEKVHFPSTVSYIGDYAFNKCPNLVEIDVNANNQHFCSKDNVLYDKNMTRLIAASAGSIVDCFTIPDGVTTISDCAFVYCRQLKHINIPSSVKTIRTYAFLGCDLLESVELPEGIESLGTETFRWCTSLKTIYIPATVTSVAENAFYGCNSLEKIICKNTVPPNTKEKFFRLYQDNMDWEQGIGTLVDKYYDGVLYVPSSSIDSYKTAVGWNHVTNIKSDANIHKLEYVIDGEVYRTHYYETGEELKEIDHPNKDGYEFTRWAGFPTDMLMHDADLTIVGHYSKSDETDSNVEPSTDVTQHSNALYFNDVEHRAGSFPLDLNMKNAEENITAFQCDVYLPEGVEWTYTTDKRGKVIYNLPAFNEDRTDNSYHTITPIAKNADGSYNIIVYSMDLETILETDGVLMTLPLEISEEMEAGEYNIILKNIVMTDVDKNQTLIDKMVSKLTIPSYQIGDANGDDLINVTDIVTTIAYIRGDSDPNFIIAAADTNEDGLINVTDIVGMIEIIRNTPSSAAPRRALAHKKVAKAAAESNLQVVPFTVAEGTTSASVKLNLNNPGEEFTAFQCDVVFPEGVKWETTVDKRGKVKYSQPTFDAEADRTDASYHTADAGVTSEGNINIMVYSMDNETILDEEGAVLDLPFVFDEGLAPGTYEITIKNIVLTRPDKTDYKPADYTFTILVGSPEVAYVSLKGNYTSEAVADFNKVLSANTSISIIDLTIANAIDESSAISTGNKNALIYATKGITTANASNLVVDGTCANLVLTDGYNFVPAWGIPFTASSATYSRTAANEWGTICLPYAMQSDANVQLYQLKERQGDMLVFTAAESLKAGEPGVYKRGDNATFTVEASNAAIETMVVRGAEAAGLKLVGSFAKARVDVDASAPSYYIKDNTFMKGNEYFNVGAFRAYFKSDGGASAAALRIAVEDATGIVTVVGELDAESGAIYTLGGVKVKNANDKGVYIQNGKKYFNK